MGMGEFGLGYIECGGVIVPAIRVELLDGGLLVTCQRKGALRAYSGPASLVGADGVVIATPEDTDENQVSWPAVHRGQVLTLPFKCSFPRPVPRVIQGELAAERAPGEIACAGSFALPSIGAGIST